MLRTRVEILYNFAPPIAGKRRKCLIRRESRGWHGGCSDCPGSARTDPDASEDDVTEPIGQEREVITGEDGRVRAEIVRDGDAWQVFKKDRPRFPPRNRTVFVARCADLEEARKIASHLDD